MNLTFPVCLARSSARVSLFITACKNNQETRIFSKCIFKTPAEGNNHKKQNKVEQ